MKYNFFINFSCMAYHVHLHTSAPHTTSLNTPLVERYQMSLNPSIVVIEDSPTQARAIAAYLEGYGIIPIVAQDGPPGMMAVLQHKPAAVILDVNLPTMNGFQIARRLKRHADTSQIPVIMLTSLDDTADMCTGLDNGADYYIPKGPHASEELYKTLCGFGLIAWH